MTIMSLAGLGANDDEIQRFRQTWPKHRSHVETKFGLIDKSEIKLTKS
jgi:transketolase